MQFTHFASELISPSTCHDAVFGLNGMKLQFFVAAHGVLVFRFVTKTVLINRTTTFWLLLISVCMKAFSVSKSASALASRLEVVKKLGEDTAGTAKLN